MVPPLEVTRDILGGVAADESHYDLPYANENVSPSPAPESATEMPSEVMRTNQQTIDDPLSQTLTWEEIEELKKSSAGGNSGRALIQKLLEGHQALHQKTPFSLQKYTLRKTNKFLKRFSVHPVTVDGLGEWLPTQKEPMKYMEIRTHHIGLMLSLANVVYGGRYLVVDETGGLLVAAVAERLGLLECPPEAVQPEAAGEGEQQFQRRPRAPLAERNSITLLHANDQPNLSLLQHFEYDSNLPSPLHPLYTHLKSLSYLQLLYPHLDAALIQPPSLTAEELAELKPGKRSAHNRKLRRWERMHDCAVDARKGQFDAVLIAAHIGLAGVLKAAVPLVRGSGMVVAYTSSAETGAEVVDYFSTARKAAKIADAEKQTVKEEPKEEEEDLAGDAEIKKWESDDMPDPTLILAPTLHRINSRRYQVLPGRTHPVMTCRGGGEGTVFSGTRVIPITLHAPATASRKRKKEDEDDGGAVKIEGEQVAKKIELEEPAAGPDTAMEA